MSSTSDKTALISTAQLMKRWKCSAACIYARAVKQNWRFVKLGKTRSYYLCDIVEVEKDKPVRRYNRKRRKPAKTLVETFAHSHQSESGLLKHDRSVTEQSVFNKIFVAMKRWLGSK